MKIVTISGENIQSQQELLLALRQQLQLPEDWSGDRIYGYLSGVSEPTTVVVTDLAVLQKQLGKPARDLQNALLSAEEQNSRYLSVLFVD